MLLSCVLGVIQRRRKKSVAFACGLMGWYLKGLLCSSSFFNVQQLKFLDLRFFKLKIFALESSKIIREYNDHSEKEYSGMILKQNFRFNC